MKIKIVCLLQHQEQKQNLAQQHLKHFYSYQKKYYKDKHYNVQQSLLQELYLDRKNQAYYNCYSYQFAAWKEQDQQSVEAINSHSDMKKNLKRILQFDRIKLRMEFKENTIILSKLIDTQEILSDMRYKKKFIQNKSGI